MLLLDELDELDEPELLLELPPEAVPASPPEAARTALAADARCAAAVGGSAGSPVLPPVLALPPLSLNSVRAVVTSRPRILVQETPRNEEEHGHESCVFVHFSYLRTC